MKAILSFLIFLSLAIFSNAQVLCIRCCDQNARVLTYTNNLILNGGFENSNCGPLFDSSFCPNSQYYHCDIANWGCTGGGFNTYARICDATFSIIVEGNNAAYFGNALCSACQTNDTSCISNIGCEVTGIAAGYPVNIYSGYGGDTGVSLSQTVTGLTIGAIYLLEFWSGGEFGGGGFINDGIFAVDVGFGNIFLREPPTPTISGIGRRFVIAFTTTSFSQTIKFTNWGHIANSYCTELILDDVRLFRGDAEVNCNTLGTHELPQNAVLSFYPNPCGEILNITCNNNNSSEMILYDITGRKLLQQQFINSTTLFTGQLTNGFYNYEVINNETMTRGKLIKH